MGLRAKAWIAAALSLLLLFLGVDGLRRRGQSCRLPVLMYHHFVEGGEGLEGTVVSAGRFREQMTALRDQGFTAVTMAQVLDYVDGGGELPKRPVLITMDDGYTSSLTIAAPILEELGMCATVFVIGINEGQTVYAHSGEPLLPERFAYEEAAPWVEKGVLDLQCHTWDMHQLASYGFSGRDGLCPLEGEPEGAYAAAVAEDLELFRQRREGRVSTDLTALAYPFGFYSPWADECLYRGGIRATFTVEERENLLRRGDEGCLWRMGRYNVTQGWSGEALARRLA